MTPEELKKILQEESRHFFKADSNESDRGVALVAAELFNVTLERLLNWRFRGAIEQKPNWVSPLFEVFGPLSTFSAKINICFATELITLWMAEDLHLLRKIRNQFAHSLEAKTFSDPGISALVGQLCCLSPKDNSKYEEASTPREKFSIPCSRLAGYLHARLTVFQTMDGTEETKRAFLNLAGF